MPYIGSFDLLSVGSLAMQLMHALDRWAELLKQIDSQAHTG